MLDKFSPALGWMTYEATESGLRMVPFSKGWQHVNHRASLTKKWKLLELLPLPRLTYKDRDSMTYRSASIALMVYMLTHTNVYWPTFRPHLSESRKIQEGQLIHESVFHRLDDTTKSYVPSALIFDRSEWLDEELKERMKGQHMEEDRYKNDVSVLADLKKTKKTRITDTQLYRLAALTASGG